MNTRSTGKKRKIGERRCNYELHEENNSELLSFDWKKIKKNDIEKVKSNIFFPRHAKIICRQCLQQISGSYQQRDEQGVSSSGLQTTVPSEEKSKDDGYIHDSNYELMFVGQKIAKEVNKDVALLAAEKQCSNVEKLISYDPLKWLEKRPSELVSLIASICDLNTENEGDVYKLARCIEQIYAARHNRLILPGSFCHSLLTYSLSNSKLLINFNNSVMASGSYSYLKEWLNQQTKDEIQMGKGAVKICFDNEQVIGKRYTVKAKSNNVPMSVITTHAYITIDEKCDLQSDASLKPSKWMFVDSLTEQEEHDFKNFHSKYDKYFRSSRNNLIERRLKELVLEQSVGGDYIDKIVSAKIEASSRKICIDCKGLNDKNYRTCRNCSGKLKHEDVPQKTPSSVPESRFDPYKHFKIDVSTNGMALSVGEPDLLNPNSFLSISRILHNLQKRANIAEADGHRKWVILENDGGIMYVLLKLLYNALRCTKCDDVIYSKENFEEHKCKKLHGSPSVYEFDWIVPQNGLLHLEMNAGKSFMSCNWNVFMDSICQELGFKTENARKYIKKGTDHHKLWQILEISYLALTDELLMPYVRFCIDQQQHPTTKGYWEYSRDVVNPDYDYVQQCTFTFLHAMMLLRRGIRYCNSEAILSAKSKLALLFFARNHPRYQFLLAHDFRIETIVPDQVRKLIHSSMSFSRTCHHGHYQSADAAIEEINKEAKKWVIGVPTPVQWLRSLRNLDKMNEIRSATLKNADLKDPSNEVSSDRRKIADEVTAVRVLLRESGYLSQPYQEKEHVSLDGKTPLAAPLVDFTETAKRNYETYAPLIIKNEVYKMSPVFVTQQEKEEYEKVENLTKNEIERKVMEIMKTLDEHSQELYFEYFQKEVRNKKKPIYISFCKVLQNVMEENETDSDAVDEDE